MYVIVMCRGQRRRRMWDDLFGHLLLQPMMAVMLPVQLFLSYVPGVNSWLTSVTCTSRKWVGSAANWSGSFTRWRHCLHSASWYCLCFSATANHFLFSHELVCPALSLDICTSYMLWGSDVPRYICWFGAM